MGNDKRKDDSQYAEVPEGWKEPEFKPEDNQFGRLFAKSDFEIKFPAYREKYLKESWPVVETLLKDYNNIKATLDTVSGTMKVETTRKTWDPYAIVRARDLIKLISRFVPLEAAKHILNDDKACEVVKIKNMTRNQEKFMKRRERLIGGDNQTTLKAIEKMSKCYVMVHGHTVSLIGPHKGIKDVRKLIEDNFLKNIHPAYTINTWIAKQQCAMMPELADESWDKLIPSLKKKNIARRKSKIVKKKKEYTPFPPPQTESKEDKLLASGEYFLEEKDKHRIKMQDVKDKQQISAEKKKKKRAAAFVAPEEKPLERRTNQTEEVPVDYEAVKQKFSKNKKKKAPKPQENSEEPKKKKQKLK